MSALLALTGAVALGAGPSVAASASSTTDSIDPFAAAGGFSVFARGDAALDNHEIEGSVAVGGELTVRRDGGGYAIIHQAAGTADYTIPTVDGDPTRLLIGSYSRESGLVEIRNGGIPGGSDASLEGYLKVAGGDPTFGLYERGGWVRYRTVDGEVPAIDATNQRWPGGQSTVYTQMPSVANYVEANAQTSYDEVAQCLATLPSSTEAQQVTVAEDAGDRKVLSELASDRVNVLQYADIAGGRQIQFSPGGPTPSASNPLVIQVEAGTTTVSGVTFDPQGAYARYVMWDLSQVKGAVTVGAPGRVDGSVYAPFADLTVDAAPLDGQIIADTLHLLGGETHAYLFAGSLPCGPAAASASFSVTKALEGSGADVVPAGTAFEVDYSYVADGSTVTGTLEVLADGTAVTGPQGLPEGTVVTLSEPRLPEVPGVVWGTPTFEPSSPVTLGAGGTVAVRLTNTANLVDAPAGGFSVAKELLGSAAGLVPEDTEFTVAYSYELDGQTQRGTLTVLADGTYVDGPQDLPVGTVVTFTEIDLPDVAGVVWGAPTFSPESVTISDGVDAQVTVTNTAAPVVVRVGGFSIQKVVTGEAADLVPEGTEFTVTYGYELDGVPTSGALVVTADGTVVNGPQNLPFGTVVTFGEIDLPSLDGVVWGAPVFSPETLAIGNGSNPTVSLTNTATDAPAGGFSIQKAVTGEASGLVPGGTEFTVSYAYDLDGVPTSGTSTVLADGTVVNGPQNLPVGTVVTFEEVDLPSLDGVVWGAPAFSPASVTIEDDVTTEVTLTNTATDEPAGGFSLRKAVEGAASGAVPAGTEFTVTYSYELDGVPTSGTATVLADGTLVDGPQNLPVGTVVTFGETDLPELSGVVWGAPAFSPASVTVADGTSAVVTVTNTADVVASQVGSFSILKKIEGPNAAKVPADTEFTVTFSGSVNGEHQEGTLTVRADGTVVDGPANLPAGTVVELEETSLPKIDGVGWGTPVFTVDGEKVSSITIGAGQVVEVTLTNTAGSGLAVTGTGALGIAAAALLLLGGGAVLLVGARRRRA
ncbi:DUF5979 domain-containing protein [Oerskovia enterophila]|uniref:DUF5979 domain-containing protein n=1 Tax=Oerskovia enterophila TaxID=43678 RepID=UPI00339B0C5F